MLKPQHKFECYVAHLISIGYNLYAATTTSSHEMITVNYLNKFLKASVQVVYYIIS